jgi:hypothetical protein
MMKRYWLLWAVIASIAGCGGLSGEQNIDISHNNLSDSYIDPYRIAVNGTAGFPAGRIGCSEGVSTSSLAMVSLKEQPRFVLVEWLHILDEQYYRAKVPLDKRTAKWLRDPPFEKATDGTPTLIVQWRGKRRVAVMLVAKFTDFSSGAVDLGEAVGETMQTPEVSPNYKITYKDLRPRPGDSYFAGSVRNYDRTLDQALTREQRFGCPRKADGTVDTARLPPEKLPFVYGADGEHIPCQAYFCADKRALRKKLHSLGSLHYPPDSHPPPFVFQDASDPRPAW